MRCRVCGWEFVGNYCPQCGSPVQPYEILEIRATKAEERIKSIGSMVWLISIISYIALFIAFIAVLFVGAYIIVPGILDSGIQLFLYFITPMPIAFVSLEGYWFVGWYLFIFAAIFISFAWLFLSSSKPTLDAIKKPLGDLRGRLTSDSTISMICQLFLALLAFTIFYYLILNGLGISTSDPIGGAGPLWEYLFALANASVYEEIITRILFIGVPLFLIHFASGVRIGRKNSYRYILGGGFALNRSAIFLLIFSSSMFAVAHVFSWDFFKVPQAFIAGLALGYLYLRKGIFASIILHFSLNYLSALGVLIQNDIMASLVFGLLILVLSVIGAVFFAYYVLRIHRHFFPKAAVQVEEEEKMPIFRCPQCGGLEARYSNGALICLNCGFRM